MPDISVQLYSVRDQITADRDAVLARLAAAGFRSVEPYNPVDDPRGLRARLDDLGLTAPTAHGWGLTGPEPEPVMEAAAVLGVRALIVSSIDAEHFADADGLKRSAELLRSLAERAAGYGLELGYHNHWWELETRIEGKYGLEYLAALAPEVFLEVDTYWAAVGGAPVPQLLAGFGERVRALHVKDGPLVKGEPNVAVGTGAMDVPAVLAAAPGALRVVEFDSCATDVLDAIEASHRYLTAGVAA
jgi:sugar phosphate isomerase/epimerase